jgi:hypothetical protein
VQKSWKTPVVDLKPEGLIAAWQNVVLDANAGTAKS